MPDYIVDFYYHELSLVIEIDGECHTWEGAPERDALRQQRIESYDVSFLRFDDPDVKKDMSIVLNTILDWIKTHEEFKK